jgi:hypothetical protein
MKQFRKESELPYSEEFVVTYWSRREDGFSERSKDSYFYASKNRHSDAERQCIKEHKLHRVDIISVVYQ